MSGSATRRAVGWFLVCVAPLQMGLAATLVWPPFDDPGSAPAVWLAAFGYAGAVYWVRRTTDLSARALLVRFYLLPLATLSGLHLLVGGVVREEWQAVHELGSPRADSAPPAAGFLGVEPARAGPGGESRETVRSAGRFTVAAGRAAGRFVGRIVVSTPSWSVVLWLLVVAAQPRR
jgi:hypothetical protein